LNRKRLITGLGITGLFVAPVIVDIVVLVISIFLIIKEFNVMGKEMVVKSA